MFKQIINRIYSDYFMPSRLEEYENFIKLAVNKNYVFLSVREYKNLIIKKKLPSKFVVNRHDIDTDISTARQFFEIEKKYKVKSTYYFRLSTLDFDFMRKIENYGSEASYHFEEIAQFAKDNHIISKNEIFSKIDEIKKIFKNNFLIIENKLGKKLLTVCSHGDFVNRKLDIINNEIIKDFKLRKELGIIAEAYDDDILSNIDIYISDKPYPTFYYPIDIFEALNRYDKIYFLTHPRQWRVNWIVNTKDNLKRFIEGIKWII